MGCICRYVLFLSFLQPFSDPYVSGGGGGVGIQGVQLAKAMGIRPIVVDTLSTKKDLALKMGAEAFVDFMETKDVTGEVVRITDGIGAHGVFVTAPQGYRDAISYTGSRVGSRIMCVGIREYPSTLLSRTG